MTAPRPEATSTGTTARSSSGTAGDAAAPDGRAYRSGSVAVVGPPNAGKSTLVNRLVGEAVSIVTPVPQTTRHRILGVLRRPSAELALLDTPGFHLPRTPLNRLMIEAVDAALADADVVLLLVSAAGGAAPATRFGTPVAELLERLRREPRPTVLGLTKLDLVRPRDRLLPIIAHAATLLPFAAIVPVSPLKGHGVEDLLAEIEPLLPEGPSHRPPDEFTDRPMRFLAAERIREALACETRQEVPHSLAVRIDRFDERPDAFRIAAAVVVDRGSHRRIVVGRAGAMIKRIGIRARQLLAEQLGRTVHLSLVVEIDEGWTRDGTRVRELTGI